MMHREVFPVIEDYFPNGKWIAKDERRHNAVLQCCKCYKCDVSPAYFYAHTQLCAYEQFSCLLYMTIHVHEITDKIKIMEIEFQLCVINPRRFESLGDIFLSYSSTDRKFVVFAENTTMCFRGILFQIEIHSNKFMDLKRRKINPKNDSLKITHSSQPHSRKLAVKIIYYNSLIIFFAYLL